MIYVMSDIHGCYAEFLRMLKLIDFSASDELYIIGDVIDRGPEPIKLLRHIMAAENICLLKGNHELMMFDSLISPYLMSEERNDMKHSPYILESKSLWRSNGGKVTSKQYDRLRPKEQIEIYNYLKKLELYKIVTVEDKNYLLLHGSPTKAFIHSYLNGYKNEDILWERIDEERFGINLISGYEIVSGHTPTFYYGKQYENKIIKAHHKYLIDCGLVDGFALERV